MKKIIVASSEKWFSLSPKVYELGDLVIAEVSNQASLIGLAASIEPDYVFVPHWNHVLPDEFIERFSTIIFHTSPLPIGRGGSPIQNLIRKGYRSSPVNALLATKDLDAGPIVAREEVSLEGSLNEILSRINISCNKMVVDIIANGFKPEEQVGEASYFKRLKPEDSRLNFLEDSLDAMYDKMRSVDALTYPRAFAEIGSYHLTFTDSEFIHSKEIIANVSIKPIDN